MLEETKNPEELAEAAYASLAPIAKRLQTAKNERAEIFGNHSKINDGTSQTRVNLEISRGEEELFRASLLAVAECGQSAMEAAVQRILDEKIYVPPFADGNNDYTIRSLMNSGNLVNELDSQISAVLEPIKDQSKEVKMKALEQFIDRTWSTANPYARKLALEAICLNDPEITVEDIDLLLERRGLL